MKTTGRVMEKALLEIGRVRGFRKGEHLFLEGDRPTAVYLVRKGRVRLGLHAPTGRGVVLGFAGPGMLLGDVAAVDGGSQTVTATALEPVEALVVLAERFRELLTEYPEFAAAVLRAMARQRRAEGQLRVARDDGTLENRVCTCLALLTDRLLDHAPPGARLVVGVTQDDLAAWIGASREEVNRALGALRSAGVLRTGRGSIEVLDDDELRRRSGTDRL